jgi:predicted nucleic acid-binding protein
LLKLFKILQLNDEIRIMTIIIRRETRLKVPDAIIAASAAACGATLLTNDAKIIKLKWPRLKVQPLRQL